MLSPLLMWTLRFNSYVPLANSFHPKFRRLQHVRSLQPGENLRCSVTLVHLILSSPLATPLSWPSLASSYVARSGGRRTPATADHNCPRYTPGRFGDKIGVRMMLRLRVILTTNELGHRFLQ